MSVYALAKIPTRHALRYSIPIAFVGFPTYPHASSSLSALNSLSSISFSLLFSSCMPPLPPISLSLSLSVSLRTYIHIFTWTAFWPRVPIRLVEGLLPVRAEISVRKFRSLAASESTTKLDINLPDYPDAILCPSVLRSPFCLFLFLDTNSADEKANECLLRKTVKKVK